MNSNSAIVAHHLLAVTDIATVFKTIEDHSAQTVIVLSPNHFSLGKSPAQISFGTWQTPYGDVASDINAVRRLLYQDPLLQNEERTFENEHGISAITPFIKRSFPSAKIVPIALHETLSLEEANTLGEIIATQFPDAVVIASIDMSHYLPSSVAQYHDRITLRSIESGTSSANLEIDSNATLRVIQRINTIRGNTTWHLTGHNDSLQSNVDQPTKNQKNWQENTSHILGYFTQSNTQSNIEHPAPFASIHFVGDIMLDRDVKHLAEREGIDAPWKNVGRFLLGSHLRVGNLEGTINNRSPKNTYLPPFEFDFTPESITELKKHIDIVSLANNHSQDVGSAGEIETRKELDTAGVKWFGSFLSPVFVLDQEVNGVPLTFIGYHSFRPDEQTLLDEIRAAGKNERFVIVLPHWGMEYVSQTTSQRSLAEKMVEAGADLIVGGHPHVIQGIELIENTPVIYSLGNFIFDQRFGDTTTGLTAGIIISKQEILIHLLPVATNNGQPSPLPDQEAWSILEKIAFQSPNKLRDQIRSGVITILYDR
ncbi:MAG: AmmeMemoRadiSam system protein B [bacterium]|nr:AmmeMemoRadiSam system protein B [bacterium]